MNDLVDRNVLNALTRNQVKALLGPASFDSPQYPGYMTYVGKADTVLDVRFAATEPYLVEKAFSRQM